MIDRQRARELAEERLREYEQRGSPDLVLTDVTQDEPFGWVFFFQSRLFLETGNFSDQLAGNAPILVLRESGEVHSLGTAYPLEHYLAKYRSRA